MWMAIKFLRFHTIEFPLVSQVQRTNHVSLCSVATDKVTRLLRTLLESPQRLYRVTFPQCGCQWNYSVATPLKTRVRKTYCELFQKSFSDFNPNPKEVINCCMESQVRYKNQLESSNTRNTSGFKSSRWDKIDFAPALDRKDSNQIRTSLYLGPGTESKMATWEGERDQEVDQVGNDSIRS